MSLKKPIFQASSLSMLSEAVLCYDVYLNITTRGLMFINSHWFP